MSLLLALVLTLDAQASWPEDIKLSGMTEHDGEPILDPNLLGDAYDQLVKELGTLVANKPMAPAETTGLYGWDLSFYTQFVFNEAIDRAGEESPWARAHTTEDPRAYQLVPTFGFRKGLPLSTEIGANVGWIGMSQTGVVGAYGRVAILEGTKPWPDITLQAGYSGYIGNDELEVGVMDLGVTMGSTWYTGMIPGANDAEFSPWLNFSSLRVSAAPLLDPEVQGDIGAIAYQNPKRAATSDLESSAPIVLPQIGIGFQVVSRNVHARVAATWAPATIPTLNTGMGFTF